MFSRKLKTSFAGILSIATAVTLTFAGVMAQARSGEGRNGPDLDGDSIPLSVDRLLTADDLKNAQDYCFSQYVGGYLLAQLQRKPFSVSKSLKTRKTEVEFAISHNRDVEAHAMVSAGLSIDGQSPEIQERLAFVGTDSYHIRQFIPVVSYRTVRYAPEGTSPEKTSVTLRLELLNLNKDGKNHSGDLFAENFPVLVYESSKDLQKVDELGNITAVVRPTNLRVVGSTADSMRLRNYETKAMTALEVSPKKYLQCISSALSK